MRNLLRCCVVASAAIVVAPLVLAACSVMTSFDGLTGGGEAPSDASNVDAVPAADADAASSADVAGDGVSPCSGPITLAFTGAVANSSGLAMQTHVVYAPHGATWWVFYLDSANPTLLKTRHSADFCTWVDGASLSLPQTHGSEGRNYSVAYADIGGKDVVHITVSHLVDASHRYHTHTRATISGGAIAYETPTQISAYLTAPSYPIDPDGPVTLVGTDGYVTDFSGWIDEGGGHIDDALAWRSTTPDQGGTWTDAWAPYVLLSYVPNVVNARAVAPLLGGGVLAMWESGSAEPDPDNVTFSVWNGSTWTAAASVFPAGISQGVDDWSILSTPLGVHVVRRTASNDFQDMRFAGGSWAAGAAIPNDPGAHDTGVVVAGSGSSTFLYAIGPDGAIRSASSTGAAWGPWSSVVPHGATRTFLSGYTSPSAGKAAVFWTEAGASNYAIVGMLVPGS